MSDNIERHKDLSKRVLIPSESKSMEQRVSSQSQKAPAQFIQAFSLGAIAGLSLFVVIWIVAGFSKVAIMAPFMGGIFGIVVEMMKQKTKT
ncbi:MAG: hypothetical protein QY310_06020 [Candidatus Jettenia sp. CY-1]|nr:hypothetical protein [Candidatus Jettenia sp.]WKZ20118.1 MAG: hypothetical protein QY310_06020 [Candidatus Jettenia sp. CY-1]